MAFREKPVGDPSHSSSQPADGKPGLGNRTRNVEDPQVREKIKNIVFSISDINLTENYKINIQIPKNEIFRDLLSVVPMQLIAYELALLKKTDPDHPVNLAKVITTD